MVAVSEALPGTAVINATRHLFYIKSSQTCITWHSCRVREAPKYQNDQCDEVHLLYAKFVIFISRHGCRVRVCARYQHDQWDEVHLSYANSLLFIDRHGCRVRVSPRYQRDQCDYAHFLYTQLATFTTRHGCRMYWWVKRRQYVLMCVTTAACTDECQNAGNM